MVEAVRGAEMVKLAPARRCMYRFLSSAFSEPPTAEALAAIRSDLFRDWAEALLSSGTAEALRRFSETVDRTPELERQAHQEFMNLFKVPGGQYVTPYESVFRDEREVAGTSVRGLLMGKSAVDVQKWYRLAALDISDEYKDLPDHVGLEFSYLACLCDKEQEFAETGDEGKLKRTWEMQRDFLAAHVVTWIEQLRDAIYEKSQHAYFRAVADLAVEFAQRDLATLESVVEPSRGNSIPEYGEVET